MVGPRKNDFRTDTNNTSSLGVTKSPKVSNGHEAKYNIMIM